MVSKLAGRRCCQKNHWPTAILVREAAGAGKVWKQRCRVRICAAKVSLLAGPPARWPPGSEPRINGADLARPRVECSVLTLMGSISC